ncbi:MAG TPA: P-II family nitrogen regulator [Anaerovoracaceae bacterium]|nr:P-II family nitrogen regulator [Anaerovoracaceae bacterium]
MKKIEAIIQPSKFEEIKEALNKMDINGITISQVMGCGNQKGWKEFYRGTELFLNILPKVQLTIVTTDENVDEVVDMIIKIARTDEFGDGKIFVINVERVIRIRSGEEGEKAL